MLLVSCFEPFGGETINASLRICQRLEQEKIAGAQFCVLPVVWKRSVAILLAEIERNMPRVVLSLGQARRGSISLERQAWNWDDFSIPDNEGQQIRQQKIIADAEDRLISTLPLERLHRRLLEENILSSFSETAGTFVCNHLFYSLQHAVKDKNICSGFVHVPLLPEQTDDSTVSMPFALQLRAVRVMISELIMLYS